ncbi:hypothetical protein [Aquipseudomonas alcaligenes]|uniref:hypothetical protein n=1 Tax=Aquipseudomonas alcaligenes TaxID=43263 RepID=UPI00117AD039|nr:hypothetical protein [Pseudomonas alcaligenes]
MAQRIIPYSIGCEPSPSVPAETLLQDGWSAFLLFFAVSQTASSSGYLEDLGVAVLECIGCVATKFGYPNDEGLSEHPLYTQGLSSSASSVVEVADSQWVKEVENQMYESTKRIRGSFAAKSSNTLRHFVICLKELTFECIANELSVAQYAQDFPTALSYVQTRFSEH